MNSKSKKFKIENDFYINKKTNKIQYNLLCQQCINECKQSFKIDLIICKRFKKK